MGIIQENLMVQIKLVVLHMEKSVLWVIEQKPGYLEHTNSDFES
jgi:hypothetical protein